MNQSNSNHVHVTGGSGFLGGFVIRALVEKGYKVSALARSPSAAFTLRQAGAAPITGDLDDPEAVLRAFESAAPAFLVNLASLGFGHAPTIVCSAETAGLLRAIFVSTTAIFTKLEPSSKQVRLAAEETIQTSRLEWTIVRPTMIYGSSQDRNMWRLLRQLRRSPVVFAPGGGKNLQQPIHVEDLASAIVATVGTGVAISKSYDLAGPEPITFEEIVLCAARALGRSVRVVPLPVAPIVYMLKLVERSGRSLPIKAEQIERLVEDKAFDISCAITDLGFSPRSFAEGICAEANLI